MTQPKHRRVTTEFFVCSFPQAKKLVARTLSGDVTDEMRQGVSWMAKAHQRLKDCTSEQTYVEHHLLALASPKLKRLLEILWHYRVQEPDEGQSLLCGIVFVEERIVAKVLCEWLLHVVEAMPSKYGFVRPCFVVGHAGSVFQSPKVFGMTFKQQCVVSQAFQAFSQRLKGKPHIEIGWLETCPRTRPLSYKSTPLPHISSWLSLGRNCRMLGSCI